jgi:hypothetical protein
VEAALAIRTVVEAVVNIVKESGFELGIIHALTIARVACGALVDISYSVD